MPAEDVTRTPVESSRSDTTPEWEVFVRETADDPLRHVGSLTAPTAAVADEGAGRLFGDPHTVWVCPADDVERFSRRSLGDGGADTDGAGAADASTAEGVPES